MPGINRTIIGAPTDMTNGTDGFLGPHDHSVSIPVDLTQFTNKEIDADGYLKPYVPLRRGGLVVSGAGQFVYGVTAEAFKVADDNADDTIAALGTVDVPVYLRPTVVRHYAEDVLDRAYTSNELSAFDAAGSKAVLIY